MAKTNGNQIKQSDNSIKDENLEKATGGKTTITSNTIEKYKEKLMEIFESFKNKEKF